MAADYNRNMKKVEQVLLDGNVVEDYDQPMTQKEIGELFYDLFGDACVKRGNQHVLFDSFGLLVANITYLGHPWPIYKKRIQLKSYFPDYYQQNLLDGIKTILLGIYRYKKQLLFAIFDAEPYMARKSHNSSAHVQTFDLRYAAIKGFYLKTDNNGNRVMIMDEATFLDHMKKLASAPTEPYDYDNVQQTIANYMKSFFGTIPPSTWNGIDCYKEMKAADARNWRQGEWPGWYFEYLFKKYSSTHPHREIHYFGDKKDGGVDFDIVFSENDWVYGDLKADKEGEDILGNAFSSFDMVLEEHDGLVLYIVLRYKAELDKKHGYKTTIFWNQFRDENRRYTSLEEIKNGYGVRMKYSVLPISLRVISIDKTAYELLKQDPFHQGRNSNGQEREPKLRINKDMIDALSVYQMNFD